MTSPRQNRRRSRYHYSPHDSSPHLPMLNIMIGIAVTLCLWNVWTAPPPATVMDSTMDYATIAQQLQQLQAIKLQQQQEPQAVPAQSLSSSPSVVSNTSQDIEIRLFPVHTAANGQKFILLSSSASRTSSIQLQQQQQESEFGQQSKATVPNPKRDATQAKRPGRENTNKPQKAPSNPKMNTKIKNAKKMQVTPRQRGLSTPLFIDTVSYEPLSSSSSSGSTSQAHHHLRPYWSSWLLGIAISGSVLAGGLLAKRVLRRMDRWEQLSKEDSLAFDVAYTTAFVYDEDAQSYESIVETTSDWSRDYLDRFDV